MPAGLHQVTIAAPDFAAMLRFYDAVLGALGLVRTVELVDEEEDEAVLEAVAWGRPDGDAQLWLVTARTPTTGLHLRFTADSRVEVETFAAAAGDAGGRVVAPPRRWTPYRRGEYTATVADPLGNRLEAVAPE